MHCEIVKLSSLSLLTIVHKHFPIKFFYITFFYVIFEFRMTNISRVCKRNT